MEWENWTKQDWALHLSLPTEDRGLSSESGVSFFTDSEVAGATGIVAGSLRLLQARGALLATKAPSMRGGYLRVWDETQVGKAAIVGAITKSTGLDLRQCASVINSFTNEIWTSVLEVTRNYAHVGGIILSYPDDVLFQIIERRYVFIKSAAFARALPEHPNPEQIIGIIKRDGKYTPTRTSILTTSEFNSLYNMTEQELLEAYLLINNCTCMTSVNLSLVSNIALMRLLNRSLAPIYDT